MKTGDAGPPRSLFTAPRGPRSHVPIGSFVGQNDDMDRDASGRRGDTETTELGFERPTHGIEPSKDQAMTVVENHLQGRRNRAGFRRPGEACQTPSAAIARAYRFMFPSPFAQ